MTIKQALIKYRKIEIDLLLSHILGKSREFLYLHPERGLTLGQQRGLTRMIKHRQKGEPMAYIVGYKDFMGLRFKVDRRVLIPRPETEELVDKVLKVCKVARGVIPSDPPAGGEPRNPLNLIDKGSLRSGRDDNLKILDIGTGSGCIAVSLARGLRAKGKGLRTEITASDISLAALKVAKVNAKRLLPLTPSPLPPNFAKATMGRRGRGIKGEGAKIKFIKSDLFKNINGKFDIIVANLPYVPKKDYESRIKNLEWEPKIALADPVKDFDMYLRFFEQVKKHLNPKFRIYLEIDPKTKNYVINYVIKYLPKAKVKFYKDLNGLWRFAEIIPKSTL